MNYVFKKDHISPACTSIPKGWNRGTKKEVAPGQIRNLKFIKRRNTRKDTNRDPAIEQELREHFDPRKPCDRMLPNERVSDLLRKINEREPKQSIMHLTFGYSFLKQAGKVFFFTCRLLGQIIKTDSTLDIRRV